MKLRDVYRINIQWNVYKYSVQKTWNVQMYGESDVVTRTTLNKNCRRYFHIKTRQYSTNLSHDIDTVVQL